jgi:hypothetical protein
VQLTELIALTRTTLTRADRTRVMVMVTMDAHARDIIAGLIQGGVTSPTAFQWQSQLKQRLQGNTAIITVADAVFTYGNEYLGNGLRLVITPLTDRIYVTATQALNLKMGCAPAGPAGVCWRACAIRARGFGRRFGGGVRAPWSPTQSRVFLKGCTASPVSSLQRPASFVVIGCVCVRVGARTGMPA